MRKREAEQFICWGERQTWRSEGGKEQGHANLQALTAAKDHGPWSWHSPQAWWSLLVSVTTVTTKGPEAIWSQEHHLWSCWLSESCAPTRTISIYVAYDVTWDHDEIWPELWMRVMSWCMALLLLGCVDVCASYCFRVSCIHCLGIHFRPYWCLRVKLLLEPPKSGGLCCYPGTW